MHLPKIEEDLQHIRCWQKVKSELVLFEAPRSNCTEFSVRS